MAEEREGWQGLVFVPEGIVKRGVVTRPSGIGTWTAELYVCEGLKLLRDDFATAEDAQRAVETACGTE